MKEIIESLFQMIIALVKAVYEIIPFTSQYGIVKYIVGQGTLFGIAWLDKVLVSLASLLTMAIVWIIATKIELNGKVKTVLSIIIFLFITALFGNWIFWCVLGGMLVLIVILWIIRSRQQFE